MKRWIAIVGWISLMTFILAGLCAWAFVGEKIQIVFGNSPEMKLDKPGASEISSGLVLLEERFDTLEETIATIGDMLAQLDRPVEDKFTARNDPSIHQIARLEGRVEELSRQLTAWLSRRTEIADPPTDRTESPSLDPTTDGLQSNTSIDATPNQDATLPTPSSEELGVVDDEESKEVVNESTGQRAAVGFSDLLSRNRWTLWDESTQFEIVQDESLIAFDGTSSVHDFTGTTNSVKGSIRFDFSKPDESPECRLEVDARTIVTQNADRDREMHDTCLQSQQYPVISYDLLYLENVKREPNATGFTAVVRGRFQIHGKEKELRLDAHLSKLPGRRLLIECTGPLLMSDFGIEPPTALAGLIRTDDKITLRVRLVARAVRS